MCILHNYESLVECSCGTPKDRAILFRSAFVTGDHLEEGESHMSKKGENIYHRKDGRWEARYKIGREESGKIRYRYLYACSEEEVKAKLTAVMQAVPAKPVPGNANGHGCGHNLFAAGSFAAVAADWMESSGTQLKRSSLTKYENLLNLYIFPSFLDVQIEQIARCDVISLVNNLRKKGGQEQSGLSPKTVTDVLSVLKNIFLFASREKGIRVADIGDISIKTGQRMMRVLSLVEQERMNQYLSENPSPCNLGIQVCLFTGMRIGEICALKWGDILFDDHILFVQRAMQRVSCEDSSERKTEVVISTPKSESSVRKIPLPDELFHILVTRIIKNYS